MSVPTIDYTGRDFTTIKALMTARVKQKFPDTWKDFSESSMGMALLEIIAFAFDTLSYYLDVQANETFLPTAQDRQSIINLGELVGYKLRPATAASVTAKVSISSVYPQAIIIPADTALKSVKGVDFEVLSETRITAGDTEADIVLTQGLTLNETFTSNGDTLQSFKLAEDQVIDESITVLVNSVEWDEQDSLVFGDEDSTIYEVKYDVDDYATIMFGDGDSGAIPPNKSSIEVSYRVGGGTVGNIPLNDISTTLSDTAYKEGVLPQEFVDITLINSENRGSGGEERETIDHAKYWIPRWVQTNNRAVTQQDFTTLASLFTDPVAGAPAYANARLKQRIPELNTVVIAVWSRDENGNIVTPSASLKDAIQAYFDNDGENAVRLVSVRTEVEDGQIVYIDIDASVNAQDSYAGSTVVASALTNLEDMFGTAQVLPGRNIHISDVYSTLQNTVGVDHSIINSITASYQIEDETIGTGTGFALNFAGTLLHSPVVPFTVIITDGTQTVTDDGSGNLVGDIGIGSNTIDYDTGTYDVTFASAPTLGVTVTCTYRYIITYQRGEVEATTDGSTSRFKDALEYPPVVPGTVAFSDGSQVVADDGNGNLIGDIDSLGNNTIDYDTGSYDFKFNLVPSADLTVRSTYIQRLQSASEDIPISDDQLGVKGRLTVSQITE